MPAIWQIKWCAKEKGACSTSLPMPTTRACTTKPRAQKFGNKPMARLMCLLLAQELAAMDRLTADPGIKALEDQGVPGKDLIHLAQHVMRGRMAYARGQFADAAEHYRRAQANIRARPPA